MEINCRVTDSENMKWKTIQMRFIFKFYNNSQVAVNFLQKTFCHGDTHLSNSDVSSSKNTL